MGAKKIESIHPMKTIVDTMVEHGISFFIVIGGDQKERMDMGIPEKVAMSQRLAIAFSAEYFQNMGIETSNECIGLTASFDALYRVTIPWEYVGAINCINAGKRYDVSIPLQTSNPAPAFKPIKPKDNVLSFIRNKAADLLARRPIETVAETVLDEHDLPLEDDTTAKTDDDNKLVEQIGNVVHVRDFQRAKEIHRMEKMARKEQDV